MALNYSVSIQISCALFLPMVFKLWLSVSMCNVFKTAVFYVLLDKHGRHIGIMSASALSHFFVSDP